MKRTYITPIVETIIDVEMNVILESPGAWATGSDGENGDPPCTCGKSCSCTDFEDWCGDTGCNL